MPTNAQMYVAGGRCACGRYGESWPKALVGFEPSATMVFYLEGLWAISQSTRLYRITEKNYPKTYAAWGPLGVERINALMQPAAEIVASSPGCDAWSCLNLAMSEVRHRTTSYSLPTARMAAVFSSRRVMLLRSAKLSLRTTSPNGLVTSSCWKLSKRQSQARAAERLLLWRCNSLQSHCWPYGCVRRVQDAERVRAWE